MAKQKRYKPPEEWKAILVMLAYGVTKNPALTTCMEYAERKYNESLRGDPVTHAQRILEDHILDGGLKAMRFKSSALIGKK